MLVHSAVVTLYSPANPSTIWGGGGKLMHMAHLAGDKHPTRTLHRKLGIEFHSWGGAAVYVWLVLWLVLKAKLKRFFSESVFHSCWTLNSYISIFLVSLFFVSSFNWCKSIGTLFLIQTSNAHNLLSCLVSHWRLIDQLLYLMSKARQTQQKIIHRWHTGEFFSWFHHFIFTLHGFITNRLNDQLPVGLFAQLVRALHQYFAEVKGMNPVQAWSFFRLSFRNCKSCLYNCNGLLYI